MQCHAGRKDKGYKLIVNIKTIALQPARWLINLVEIQEKKQYHFFVIIIFALFVALIRFLFELMVANRPLYGLNVNMVHMFTFYLHCIFIYTLILKLLIPGCEWRKSIHLVLIGVFLGIFPPIIDSFYYGIGNFKYGYVNNFTEDWRLFIYNPEAHVPVGEALVLYLTIFFTSMVVLIKTSSPARAFWAVPVCYAGIFFYAALLPNLAFSTSGFVSGELSHKFGSPLQANGYTGIFFVSLFQMLSCMLIYFVLNPEIFFNLAKRINHAIPVFLTALLGYAVIEPVDMFALFVASLMIIASLSVIVQNDYFDKEEDQHEGRKPYVDINDVRFFNFVILGIIVLLAATTNLLAYMLLLFFIVSVIYNYDFYRGKRFFPANYKVEGVWGLSAFLCGVAMVISTEYLMMGEALIGRGIGRSHEIQVLHSRLFSEIWTSEILLFSFLVFGGWSIISVIKDYKDIESDVSVGNQTAYSLLSKRGKSIENFHKKYTIFLSLTMLIPILWIRSLNMSWLYSVLLIILIASFYVSISRKPSIAVVEQSLLLVNFYILGLVFVAHFSHSL